MKPGSGLLLAAGALATATTTTSAFVLPPKVTQPRPTGPTQPKPLQVKTGNWFGEGVGGGSNPFGEMKLALRDALWKADEAIQRMAVPAFNESTGESLVAAFQAKLQQAAAPRKQQQPEPTVTKFAVASPPPAAPVAAAKPKASAAVPPPMTRTPPPPPRMPPTDDEEEKKKQQAQAQAAKPTMTVTEKPAVVIPPSPTAVPQVPPAQAPVSAAAKPTMTVAPPAAAAPATPAAAPTPVAVKSARELVAEKARSAPINTVAASTPYTAAVPEIREDPQVVRARSQRWAEDVVKRAKRQEAETVAKKAASSSSLSSVAASPAVAAAALEKARKRRQEEKAAEQARRAKAAAAREKLRAERAAALKAIEQRLVVGKEEPVLAVKPAMPAAQAAAAVESMAAKAKEAAAASAAAAMVVDVKGQAQPTVGALMAAAQKEMDAAVTKAEAVVTAASKAVIFEKVEAEDEAQPDRSSVETMLRDSKAAAVEEWHRARTATTEAGDGIKGKPASALDEKAAQLEARLVEEIRAGPGEGIMGCVDLLEKVGETQLATPAQAAAETGRWDLAYSSGPVASLLALPRWLARFLVGLSATVDTSNNGKVAVVYRAVFKFLDWLPRLRRTQRAAVQPGASPRQQAEVLSGRPRFTLGKRLSFTLPRFLAKLGTAADVVEAGEAPRLTSSCTYLGSQLKICRVARPASGAEPLVAVYLRGNPARAYNEEDMLALPASATADAAAPPTGSGKKAAAIRSPAVNKLFQRFNKNKRAAGAA